MVNIFSKNNVIEEVSNYYTWYWGLSLLMFIILLVAICIYRLKNLSNISKIIFTILSLLIFIVQICLVIFIIKLYTEKEIVNLETSMILLPIDFILRLILVICLIITAFININDKKLCKMLIILIILFLIISFIILTGLILSFKIININVSMFISIISFIILGLLYATLISILGFSLLVLVNDELYFMTVFNRVFYGIIEDDNMVIELN